MRTFLRHFFLPHETNNHRAKALHSDTLLVYILVLSLLNFGIRILHLHSPLVLGYATDIRLDQLLNLTNQRRQERGLSALQLNDKLSLAAYAKAQDMFSTGYWSHTSPKGRTPWQFIVNAGYRYTMAGENLAKNFSTSKGVVDAWMASSTHRANIIKPAYQDVGFAIVNGVLNGEETTLIVQMFGASGVSLLMPNVSVPAKELALGGGTLGEAITASLSERTQILDALKEKVFSQSFSSVIRNPLVDIPTLTRDIAFLFIGFLVGILVIDGFLVSRRNLIRVSGHNLAHILFLVAICITLFAIKRGVLL